MRFGEPQWLLLLWLAPILAALVAWRMAWGRRALRVFASAGLLREVGGRISAARRWIRAGLAILAIGLAGVALARPQWDEVVRERAQRGRDVAFVVDVSRSMLAEDLAPNRLERAKLAIKETVDILAGDRVALVAFAGTAVVKCPLTVDYAFMRLAVDDLSTESVARGGTAIGDAVRVSLEEVFDEGTEGYRDLILITDGEDHETFPVEAAQRAGDAGVRIIAIGLGDPEGARIPVYDERGGKRFVTHEGQEVWTKLDVDTLRKMAAASDGGVALNVGTGNFNLDEVYLSLVRAAKQREREEGGVEIDFKEQFQPFLAVAILALLLEAGLADRRRRDEA